MFLGIAVIALVLLAVLPPLISLSRYQHRISTSISTSLGRPVHFEHVSLNVLPVPSFTISKFVVEEDPAFGAEPIIRSDEVQATLRVSSLWRRRVEFSRISFADPSVNLVHDHRGKWNLEGILLQASQIESAPTGQPTVGSAPRFPYVEATGARINLKQGVEKTPFSLTEADFALWRPDPEHWRMRLKGRPVRTNTSVSETGSFQMEATLGRAQSIETVPLEAQASWRDVPLGEASRLFVARDLELRGTMTVTATVHGNLSENALQTHLVVNGLRRSDFVPEQSVTLNVECKSTANRIFHTLKGVQCEWPVPGSDGATLALAGAIPDVLRLETADLQVGTSRLPASVLLGWLRVLSSRVPPSVSATGLLSGSLVYDGPEGATGWTGEATLPELQISGGKLDVTPVTLSEISVHPPVPTATTRRAAAGGVEGFVLAPVSVDLGGKEPARLEGAMDRRGYSLHLSGMVVLSRLLALGSTVPPLGDGLADVLPDDRGAGPMWVDLAAHRDWAGEPVWTDGQAQPRAAQPRSRARRTRRRR